MRILMCRPNYYGIHYEINPWMHMQIKVNHDKAVRQWEDLFKTLNDCGAKIDLVEPALGWPDMTFTANAGLLYQNKIILSHFKYKERQGETPFFKEWFINAGFEVINDQQKLPAFEGAGDALIAGKTLYAGFGFRTDKVFYEKLSNFHVNKLIYCQLVDPYYYHIDTCFCPLNETLGIWYPKAFNEESQNRMAKEIELIPVNDEEAKRFACNAVVIDQHVILPTHCPEISKTLKQRGFIVHACEMNEYIKAGGACKCLTLRLDH